MDLVSFGFNWVIGTASYNSTFNKVFKNKDMLVDDVKLAAYPV